MRGSSRNEKASQASVITIVAEPSFEIETECGETARGDRDITD